MGFRPSPPDARDWKLHKLGAASPTLPNVVDNDWAVEDIYDQNGFSSCCGWGTARAWHVRARIQGDATAPFPSANAIYSLGRAALLADAEAPLVDDGCYPRMTLAAAAGVGVVPLERWNDPSEINDRPDLEVLRESADTRGVKFARVGTPEEIRQALAHGYPVVVGFDVDHSFMDYSHGAWTGMKGRAEGGHCTCLIGYKQDAVRGVNSWGESWGESGLYWISDSALLGVEGWAVQLVDSTVQSTSIGAEGASTSGQELLV